MSVPNIAWSSTECLQCTGEQPCQTCTTFNTECVYDRSQDRRSKAYFQRKLAQGVQEALESDDRANLLDILKSSGSVDDDVALGFREAMQLAEQDRQAVRTHSAKVPLTLSNPGTVASFEESDRPMVSDTDGLVCDTLCAVGIPGVTCPEWVSKTQWIQQQAALSGPQHLMQPFIIEDHSPLSRLYKSFMTGARQMIAEGAATLEGILGPLDAEVDLLYRDRIPSDAFCASTFACEVVKYYSNVDLDTQMAHAFLLARWMRWILAPNRENYVLLPELVKPTRLQQRVPHFASAGVQVLPEIRDHLVRGELQMTQDIGPQASAFGIKFNWGFDKWQAVERNPVTGVTTVSRLFAESVVDVENWSCPKNFTEHSAGPDAIIQVINHHHSWNRLEAFLAAS